MASIAAASLPPLSSSLTPKKENATPFSSKIEELNESRAGLFDRIQGLKKDLQTWRSKLDLQVKVYRDELSEIKQSLNTEVEQLRSEFQELRTTLQQQQDDVLEDVNRKSKADELTLEGNKESDASPTSEVEDYLAESSTWVIVEQALRVVLPEGKMVTSNLFLLCLSSYNRPQPCCLSF